MFEEMIEKYHDGPALTKLQKSAGHRYALASELRQLRPALGWGQHWHEARHWYGRGLIAFGEHLTGGELAEATRS